jgi:hypothetical protein
LQTELSFFVPALGRCFVRPCLGALALAMANVEFKEEVLEDDDEDLHQTLHRCTCQVNYAQMFAATYQNMSSNNYGSWKQANITLSATVVCESPQPCFCVSSCILKRTVVRACGNRRVMKVIMAVVILRVRVLAFASMVPTLKVRQLFSVSANLRSVQRTRS